VNEFAAMDKTLDELLVQLGAMVLRLSRPEVTRTPEERRALVLSVNKFAACAMSSDDPRVQELKSELEAALKPPLRLVAGR
jgi:hypothetical protein